MAIDKKTFIQKYVLESEDILKKVNENILYLEKFPDDKNIHNELMRSFHTIKGTSRMMGFNEMSDLAHKTEDFLTIISRKKVESPVVIDFLFKLSDLIKEKLQSIKSDSEISLKDFLKEFTSLIEKEDLDACEYFIFPEFKQKEKKRKVVAIDTSSIDTEVVKIKTDRLDIILKDINEVMIHYLNVKNTTNRLLQTLQKIKGGITLEEINVEDMYQKFYTIYKGYRDHLGKMEIYISQIQDSLFDLKMLPISIIFDQLPKAARDIARQLKKRVEVEIESENSYLDKSIIEKFDEPVIHLLRNAIAHGIESPEERRILQKNEIGKITIKSFMESGNVIIKIKDDGKGLDTEAIKKHAVDNNIISRNEIDTLSNEEILNLIFLPQISTSDNIDDISGRGVGMEIIKKSIEDLKGSISMKTEKGKGTEFTVLLPLTLSTISVLFISCNNVIFAVPLAYIEEIVNVKDNKILDVSNTKVIKHRDAMIKIVNLHNIIPMNAIDAKKYKFIMIIKSLDLKLGLFIDDIISESEIVIKPLPDHLKDIRTIMGVTINNINEISNILHIPSVIDKYFRDKSGHVVSTKQVTLEEKKSVLVVDDVQSIRDVLKSILADKGYSVDEAENGKIALSMLDDKKYDIVLTDIKMPIMDGLSLLKSIKQKESIKSIPVIVISSLRDKNTVSKARDLGASKYIVKDKFKAATLINIVGQFIG